MLAVLTVWVFRLSKKEQGEHAVFKALCLGNGIMGACFQAPHATPGQWQMETLSWVGWWAVRRPLQKNNKRNLDEIVCDSGIKITWVQVSRLPMPHPDKDRWKHTVFTNKFLCFSMLLWQDHIGMYRVSNAILQHAIIMIIIIMIIIILAIMIIKWKVFLVKNFLLKGVDYITVCNQKNKCPSKPEFNVNMVLLPFLVVHHHH